MQKYKVDPLACIVTKGTQNGLKTSLYDINLLNSQKKTYKKKLYDVGFGNDFSALTPKAQDTEVKIEQDGGGGGGLGVHLSPQIHQ